MMARPAKIADHFSTPNVKTSEGRHHDECSRSIGEFGVVSVVQICAS